jgi:hypothetical protein
MPYQRCEGYNGSATGPGKKSTINNKKVKSEKKMAEVWRKPPEEDDNAATAYGNGDEDGNGNIDGNDNGNSE